MILKDIKNAVLVVFILNLTSIVFFPDSSLAQVLTVDDISDLQPQDSYYRDVKSLTEKYECYAGYPDGTLRGNRSITRMEFATVLSACLDRLSSKAQTQGNLSVFLKRIRNYSASPNGEIITNVSQLSFIQPTDFGFEAVVNLLERYNIVLIFDDKSLRSWNKLTYNELADYLNGIFQYRNVPLRGDPVTRGDLSIYLNRALNLTVSDLFN